jgi:hypothetical protein
LPYWVFYSRANGSDRSPDFRLQVIPGERNKHIGANPLVTDARGEIIAFTGLWADGPQRRKSYGPLFAVRTDDAGIEHPGGSVYTVRERIRDFMQKHDAIPPASLAELLDDKTVAQLTCSSAPDPTQIRIGLTWEHPCYAISYFAPSDERPRAFAFSLQRLNYGNGCIRSFFLDFDGDIHTTSEPRAATAHDPSLLPCDTAAPCQDTIWALSKQPPKWMFFWARLHYIAESTDWL